VSAARAVLAALAAAAVVVLMLYELVFLPVLATGAN
jgi:hypothetical protein